MGESQDQIDALLAEVNALADEAVSDIVGAAESSSATTVGTATIEAPSTSADAAGGPAPIPEGLSRVLRLEVPVIVQLAERTMPLSEILNLTSGSIVEFEKASDSELDLMINNKCVGQGQAVKVGENFGLRVTSVGSVRARIEAMGKR